MYRIKREEPLRTAILLKGTKYTPEYREKLLTLDMLLGEYGTVSSEHALNRVYDRLISKSVSYNEGVNKLLDIINNGDVFIDPGQGIVKMKHGISLHFDDKGVLKTAISRKKAKDSWIKR